MRRLKLFALLCSIAAGICVWWYCSNRRCSDESLVKIDLGMSYEEVTKLLGQPVNQANYVIDHRHPAIISSGLGEKRYYLGFTLKPKFILTTSLVAKMNNAVRTAGDIDPRVNHYWLGQHQLLWLVTNEKGVVFKRFLMAVSEQDSPAIAWIKEQISKWW